MRARVLAHDDAPFLAHYLGPHRLVGRRLAEYAVDVYPGLVRERVLAHYRLVRLDLYARQLGHEPRHERELARVDGRRDVVERLECHHDLFERGVPGPLAQAVHRDMDLLRPSPDSGKGVGDRQAEVVVAVDRQRDLRLVPYLGHELHHRWRGHDPDGVRDVDPVHSDLLDVLVYLVQEVQLRPGRVLAAELRDQPVLLRVGDGLDGLGDGLLLRYLQLLLEVDLGRREEYVYRVDIRAYRRVDVHLARPAQGADLALQPCTGDLLDRFRLALGVDGEPGLDYVHSQLVQRLRDLDLVVRRERDVRRLLPVPQGRVQYLDPLRHPRGLEDLLIVFTDEDPLVGDLEAAIARLSSTPTRRLCRHRNTPQNSAMHSTQARRISPKGSRSSKPLVSRAILRLSNAVRSVPCGTTEPGKPWTNINLCG